MTGSEICSKDKCSGCMACFNVCPKACISMTPGKLDHLYPEVNQDLCINCRMCQRVCPENNHLSLHYPLTAFAGWHSDREQYLTSTSGGAATAFAQTIIRRGGVVYGCASEPGLKFRHTRIADLESLVRLKGSKYVQSDIGHIYSNVKQDLKSSLTVLFIGTPCQCAGLKSYLGKDYDNLYCVDLICHGVPSQKLLKKHLNKISSGKADYVTFRKGNDMALRVFDKSGEKIYYSNVWNQRYRDVYYSAFIDGYTYRDSCYSCGYARPERCSDVTIGDFWGLSNTVEHDSINGCSCILPITEKGYKLVKESELTLIERSVAEAVDGNSQLRHPSRKTRRVRVFQSLLYVFGADCAYRLCELDRIFTLRIIKPIRRRLKV